MKTRSRTSTRAKSAGSTCSEHAIQSAILATCQRPWLRLFRNNTGAFVVGQGRDRRFFRSGLCKGSADIIGWKREPVMLPTVGGEMLATYSARFVAVEVKSARGKLTPEQTAFLEDVRAAGGLAGVARSVADAVALLGLGVDSISDTGGAE